MNNKHIDFRRTCVLIAVIFLLTFTNAAAEPVVPTAFDFAKTQTKNSAIYFSAEDFAKSFSPATEGVKSIKIVSLPERGTLLTDTSTLMAGTEIAYDSLSSLIYTPESDAVYETSFLYQARGEGEYSGSAKVTIIITETAEGPLRTQDSSITTKKNTPVNSAMIGSSETEFTHKPEFMIVDAPTKGKVDVTDVHTGTFVYTPFTDQTGEDVFTFKLVMAPYESKVSTVTITIEDTPETTLFQYADLQNHWAAYSAAMLVERNITVGERIANKYYYRPDRQLTRADFVLLITAAVGLDNLPPYSGTKRFADEGDMPSYLIEPAYRALEAGIISGIGNGDAIYFAPNNTLSRIEAIMMINNTINPDYESTTELDYADVYDIPQWAVQAVKNMEGYGLIKGYDDNTLRPHALIIKSQGGEMIYQLVKYLDAYPQTRAKLSGSFVYEAQPISYDIQKGYISTVVR